MFRSKRLESEPRHSTFLCLAGSLAAPCVVWDINMWRGGEGAKLCGSRSPLLLVGDVKIFIQCNTCRPSLQGSKKP